MRYVITAHTTETRWTVVEAEDDDAAMALIEDGDDQVGPWIAGKFNADYDTAEAQPDELALFKWTQDDTDQRVREQGAS